LPEDLIFFNWRVISKYTHPSIFAVSQIRRVSERIKIYHSDPSIDRRLGPIPHDVQGAESKMKAAAITVFLQKKEKTLKLFFFWRRGHLLAEF